MPHDRTRAPYTIPNAFCIHEEDAGVLWRHVDHEPGAEVRRIRRLVVSFHVTVATCEYLVDNRTYAPFHQHFIVARMDLDIDGSENTVDRTGAPLRPTGPANPHRLALTVQNTAIETEGFDDFNRHTERAWKATNDNARNGLGTPVSDKLVPGGAIPSMLHSDAPVLQRSQVIDHTVWVTLDSPDERWPSGEFVNRSSVDHGLPGCTLAQRPVTNTDVVLWCVFGIHHITRPEEWPIMSADIVSFWLKPSSSLIATPPSTWHRAPRRAAPPGPIAV